jgi:hypothetical protein
VTIEPLPIFLAFLIIVALVVFWRLTNARVSVTWESKTTSPEPSKADVAGLKRQRDEARSVAKDLREAMENGTAQLDTMRKSLGDPDT